jgi:hypothetical protein
MTKDSAARRQSSGKKWEAETLEILKGLFPEDIILAQVTTPFVPHARPDFAIVKSGLIVECKACGLTPVQEKELIKHKERQNLFESLGMTYIWWVDRERDNLIGRTRTYLKHVFYNCKHERTMFIEFLNSFHLPKSMRNDKLTS